MRSAAPFIGIPSIVLVLLLGGGCSSFGSPMADDTDAPRGDDRQESDDGEDTEDTFGGPELSDTALTDDPDTAVTDLCGNGRIDPGEFC